MPIDQYLDKIEGIRQEKPRISLKIDSQKDQNSYVLLSETKEHPNLLVAQTRLVYTSSIEHVLKSLDIDTENNDDRDPLYPKGYLGNIDYQQAIDLNKALGGFTLPLNLFVEFLNKLRSGNALDENNNPIDPRRIEAILNDIYEVRSPWRSEWLNHKYSEKDDKILVTYTKFDTSGQLTEVTEELDKDTLEQDKLPGISLDAWLRNPTSQGLPRSNVGEGALYYWHPRDGKVAWFVADSDWAGLYCNGGPTESYPALGVRCAKIKQ